MTEKLEMERARGAHAQQILDDPLLKEAFATVERGILSAWRTCADPQERESLWLKQKLLSEVRGHLSDAALTGRMAAQQLETKK